MNKVLANGHIEFVGTLSTTHTCEIAFKAFLFKNSVVIPQLTHLLELMIIYIKKM